MSTAGLDWKRQEPTQTNFLADNKFAAMKRDVHVAIPVSTSEPSQGQSIRVDTCDSASEQPRD